MEFIVLGEFGSESSPASDLGVSLKTRPLIGHSFRMKQKEYRVYLESKTKDDLRVLAKKIELIGYSKLNKPELIEFILTVDLEALKKEAFPSWWSSYHNHVYGVVTIIALVFSVVFYFVPLAGSNDPYLNGSRRIVDIVETPIGFVEYSSMNKMDRLTLFNRNVGKEVTWEGYIVLFNGFYPGALEEFSFEKPIGLTLVPRKISSAKIIAQFKIEPVIPTDSGYDLMSQLFGLREGQRLRMTGRLGGTPDKPILIDSQLDKVFATDE